MLGSLNAVVSKVLQDEFVVRETSATLDLCGLCRCMSISKILQDGCFTAAFIAMKQLLQ